MFDVTIELSAGAEIVLEKMAMKKRDKKKMKKNKKRIEIIQTTYMKYYEISFI